MAISSMAHAPEAERVLNPWMVLSTGMPFALFKFGGGLIAARDIHAAVGVCLMAWGVSDAILNLTVLFPRLCR